MFISSTDTDEFYNFIFHKVLQRFS